MSKSQRKKEFLTQLRKKAEENFLLRAGKASLIETKHELAVYEIELEMQNAELRETQYELRSALQEYSELFEFSPVAYYILDKKGFIEKVNIQGAIQLGCNKVQLIGKSFSNFLNAEFDQDNFYLHMNRVIDEGSIEKMECKMKKKDGSVFSALIKSKVMKKNKRQFKQVLSMVTDISHIKEHERQIEIQLTRSEELNKMKSRFISMASHEFRTPLTAVLSSTSLIEQYAGQGNTQKMIPHFCKIKSSIKNLVDILEEFLSIEKIESGKVEIKRITFDLREICEDLIEEVDSIKKNGQVIVHHHTGSTEIYEDRRFIQQILLNLLSNACKYSPEEKEIKLFTTVSGQEITIIVEDRGMGIPENEQVNVFNRFFRAHNTEGIQGTGLGLNIVKRYVELLNGTITFASKHHEGTTFRVTLPYSI